MYQCCKVAKKPLHLTNCSVLVKKKFNIEKCLPKTLRIEMINSKNAAITVGVDLHISKIKLLG